MRIRHRTYKIGPMASRIHTYTGLDWRLNDAQLGRIIGRTHAAVRYWRRKFGHRPHPRGNPHL